MAGLKTTQGTFTGDGKMEALIYAAPIAAAGYSFVYLLAGGGVGGAIVIFLIAKLLGK